MVALLEQQCGLCSPLALAAGLRDALPGGAYDHAAAIRYLLSLGIGDIRLHRGQLVVSNAELEQAVTAAEQAIIGLMTSQGAVTVDDLTPAAAMIGATDPEVVTKHATLLAQVLSHEVLPGLYSHRRWNKSDYASFVLSREGRAMHFRDVAAEVGALRGIKYADQAFNTVLNTDGRFVRVGPGDFALADWGAERYGRFNEVIERFLRRGRAAEHIDLITTRLLQQYTVARATVLAMLTMHRDTFRYYGDGYWGLVGLEPVVSLPLEEAIADAMTLLGSPMTLGEIGMVVRTHPQAAPDEVARLVHVSPRFKKLGPWNRRQFALARWDVDGAA